MGLKLFIIMLTLVVGIIEFFNTLETFHLLRMYETILIISIMSGPVWLSMCIWLQPMIDKMSHSYYKLLTYLVVVNGTVGLLATVVIGANARFDTSTPHQYNVNVLYKGYKGVPGREAYYALLPIPIPGAKELPFVLDNNILLQLSQEEYAKVEPNSTRINLTIRHGLWGMDWVAGSEISSH